MTSQDIVALAAFALTALALYLLSFYPFIPAWAVFISWACFFHLDGGLNRKQAFIATIQHIGLGAICAWFSALLLLGNPIDHELASALWGPLMIGVVIAIIAKMSMLTRFCIMPAVIYGYASIFAFLNAPGFFSSEALLSLSFQNAIIAIGFSIVLGATAGYINAVIVNLLSKLFVHRSGSF